MIPNGKIDDKHNGTVYQTAEKKTFHGSHRGPYLQDRAKQPSSFKDFQNGGDLDRRGSVFPNNSPRSEFNDSTKDHVNGWNRNGFVDNNNDLSFEQMWELRRIIDKRVKNKVSEGLSPEGRKAMELARAELEYSKRKGKKSTIAKGDNNNTLPELTSSNSKTKSKMKKKISFVDAYEGSSASRLSGDIMDESSSDGKPKRWALGGGNINVAMETVEIVSYGETQSESDADDIAIEETAKLNSVEKCLVWMDVHRDVDYDEQR